LRFSKSNPILNLIGNSRKNAKNDIEDSANIAKEIPKRINIPRLIKSRS
jgi:hypothetical protein